LRGNHPIVENYSIPKIIYLSIINDKLKTRDFADQHLLDQHMNSVINSDQKNSAKAAKNYEKLIKGYYNGRRNS